jgi:3-isopropylmalate/(R)-2-methylmalate dehydratase small subunit
MNTLRTARVAGPAVGVDGDDIDTDCIFPARHMLRVRFDGLGAFAFGDVRKQARDAGATHPFDDPARADARVLLVDRNFGCGSSREHAPQSLLRWNKGIAAIVGDSFAEIFFGNCVAIGIPCVTAAPEDLQALKRAAAADPALEVVVDLEKKLVKAGSLTINVSIPEAARRQFLTGSWDSVSELREAKDQVAALAATLPSFGPRKTH